MSGEIKIMMIICARLSRSRFAYGIEYENPLNTRGEGEILLNKAMLIITRIIRINDAAMRKNQPRNSVITSYRVFAQILLNCIV